MEVDALEELRVNSMSVDVFVVVSDLVWRGVDDSDFVVVASVDVSWERSLPRIEVLSGGAEASSKDLGRGSSFEQICKHFLLVFKWIGLRCLVLCWMFV